MLPLAVPGRVDFVTTLIVWWMLRMAAATPSATATTFTVSTRSARELSLERRPDSVRKTACQELSSGVEVGRQETTQRLLISSGLQSAHSGAGDRDCRPARRGHRRVADSLCGLRSKRQLSARNRPPNRSSPREPDRTITITRTTTIAAGRGYRFAARARLTVPSQ
jgi:hypothetical protein